MSFLNHRQQGKEAQSERKGSSAVLRVPGESTVGWRWGGGSPAWETLKTWCLGHILPEPESWAAPQCP